MADVIRLGGRLINLDNFCYSSPTSAGQVIYMTNGRMHLSDAETRLFLDEVDRKSRTLKPVAKTPQTQRTKFLKSNGSRR